jgi:Neuraminidase (sialidase)
MNGETWRGIFIESGGFFPVLAKHGQTAYVFCRTHAGHLGPFGKITLLISNNGLDWYERGTIQKENSDVRNPSVYVFSDDALLVAAYKYNVYNKKGVCSPSELSSPKNQELLLFHSNDKGKTWQEGKTDFSNIYKEIGGASPHGQMLIYNQQLLMPVYNKQGAFLLSSADKGKNWNVFSHIAGDMQEPSVAVTPDNELLAVLRAGRNSPQANATFISRYANGTWTLPVSVTEPMQHPANLLALINGQILMTFSDRNPECQRILARLSSDNGQTWSKSVQISKTFQNCDFGYPSTVELKEGELLTVFYANPVKNPYFYFGNPDFYENMNAAGYYCRYSLDELQ